LQGRCPQDLKFAPTSLAAIHSSQVFHFLTGEELIETVENLYNWLIPGGEIFLIVSTPYVKMLESFIPTYEHRKKNGMDWPGVIDNFNSIKKHPLVNECPDFMHFLDDEILGSALREAGFIITQIEMFKRNDMPDHIALDGRENLGVIAKKPSL
jgi:polyketide synthase PksL